MRVTCNIDELLDSLKKLEEEVTRKLEGMVEIFVYNIAYQAIENTPYGNAVQNARYYNSSARLKWFMPVEGSAKGGWTVTMETPSRVLVPLRADSENAINTKEDAERDSKTYKLGDTVYIMNSVPYVATAGFTSPSFGSLEGGYSAQAPQGIMGPTVDSILGVYQLKLNEYYKAT
jgi:hypothetical protein